jgi:hypothetical protein
MKGSIRIIVGFLITYGSVGGIETGTASLIQGMLLAAVGLALMYYGAMAATKGQLMRL